MEKLSIPDALLNDIKNEECVLFLGAGASTEGSFYFGKSLVDLLAVKCKYPISWGEVMASLLFSMTRLDKLAIPIPLMTRVWIRKDE